MNFNMSMNLEGKQVVSWITENKKTDKIDIVLDTFGNESTLSFDPLCFDAFVRALNEFQQNGKISHSYSESCTGKTELNNFFLDISRDKKFTRYQIKFDHEDVLKSSIVLAVKSSFEEASFHFSDEQMSKIMSRFKTFLNAKRNLKLIKKEMAI